MKRIEGRSLKGDRGNDEAGGGRREATTGTITGGIVALERWFSAYVDRYRDRRGALHPLLELKHLHSLRVAENANRIAAALDLPETERRFAGAAGLVHDVGRFRQFARYGSFRDADTIDHGAEGRRILEEQDLFLLSSAADRERLLIVVANHNRKRTDLPVGLSPAQSRLLGIIRDADKLDIMDLVPRAVASDGFKDLTEMLPHIRLSRTPTPAVLAEAERTRSVSSGNLRTLGDVLVMLATWCYDLNCAPTRRLLLQRGILARLRRELPDEKDVDGLWTDIAVLLETKRPIERKGPHP